MSHATDGSGELDELRKQVSNLQGSNHQQETTIQSLQQQLADLAEKHDTSRQNSERMADIAARQKAQLKKELRAERKAAAEALAAHEREVEERQAEAREHERARQDAEADLAARAARWERQEEEVAEKVAEEAAALQRQLAEAEAEYGTRLQRLEGKCANSQERADGWKDKYEGLEARHDRLRREREEVAAAAAAFKEELEGSCVAVAEARGGREQAAAAAAALNNELAAKSSLNDELAFKVGKLNDEKDRLQSRCQQLERDLRQLSATAAKEHSTPSGPEGAVSSSRDLARELAAARGENDQASATIAALEAENLDLRASIEGAVSSSQALAQELTAARKENDRASATITTLEAENVDLKASVEGATSSSRNLAQELAAARKENDRASATITTLEAENADLKASVKGATSSSGDLAKELVSAQKENDRASATITTLEAENLDLKALFANQCGTARRRMKDLMRSLRSLTSVAEEPATEAELEENGELSRITEMNHKEALSQILAMEANNDALFVAVEEAMRLANEAKGSMKDELARATSSLETSVNDYKAKLAQFEEEFRNTKRSNKDLATELETTRKEKERECQRLFDELATANSLVVSSVRDEIEKEKLSEVGWERERLDLCGKIERLKGENAQLHASVKDMDGLVRQNIEKERQSRDGWDQEQRELSAAIARLEGENAQLRSSMEDTNALVARAEEFVGGLRQGNTSLEDAREYFAQQEQELIAEREANQFLREEIKGTSAEKEEAQGTCKRLKEENGWLQEEINMLRASLKDSTQRIERSNSVHSGSAGSAHNEDGRLSMAEGSAVSLSSKENQERLDELTRANKKLTGELEQKHRALQAVQSVLANLKEEQGSIKETIAALRAENAQLLRRPAAAAATDDGRHEKQVHKLERRIRKSEKENRGLRETSATLSTKLFDEMEKTDALRVANEGLAARICKLVAFIQQAGHSDAGSVASPGADAGAKKGADTETKKGKRPPRSRSKNRK